jgi:hypothetical protein
MEDSGPEFILTRYLYSKTNVTHSLFLALLEHRHREALYWAYEIYFSGFPYDVLEFLERTYQEIYKNKNPDLENFINTTITSWNETNMTQHWLLGSIVYTLSKREYDLSGFVESYFKIKCIKCQKENIAENENERNPKTKKKFIIHMRKEDVEMYKTIDCGNASARDYIDHVLEFPIRKNVIDLFNSFEPENITEIYANMDNWLYYAAKSLIWSERLAEYGAVVNETYISIDFPNEDKKEAFYEKWNYDIEDQPLEIQDAINGEDLVQITLKDFAAKYGTTIVKNKKKTILKISLDEPLENTITLHYIP